MEVTKSSVEISHATVSISAKVDVLHRSTLHNNLASLIYGATIIDVIAEHKMLFVKTADCVPILRPGEQERAFNPIDFESLRFAGAPYCFRPNP